MPTVKEEIQRKFNNPSPPPSALCADCGHMFSAHESFLCPPRVETVLTRLDGLQPVYYYERHHFDGRKFTFASGKDFDHMEVESVQIIPDSEPVICDFCNDVIEEFPCPVLRGSYALCPKCWKNVLN